MTIREYISQKLPSFNLTEAQFADIYAEYGLDVNQEYSVDNKLGVNKAIIGIIERYILAPKLKSVNEGGFSMTWNYDDLGKLYVYLCKKYGVPTNPDIESTLGIKMIKDASAKW